MEEILELIHNEFINSEEYDVFLRRLEEEEEYYVFLRRLEEEQEKK